MKSASLNERTIKTLRAPARGNSITYFAGATIQGARAPRGFGVRVTASGARAFILNYRLRGREHRFTIGAWPDWSALKAVREARNLRQRVDRGDDPLKDTALSKLLCLPLKLFLEVLFFYQLRNNRRSIIFGARSPLAGNQSRLR